MHADCVKCNVTAGGTGALTLGAAVVGFRTPADASIGNTGYVNYRVTWDAGWAVGIGTLSADALTLTRSVEYCSDATNLPVAVTPYRSVPSSGAVLSVVADARSAGQSTMSAINVNGVRSIDCYATGGGGIDTGSPNSLVVGPGAVDVNSPAAIVLGGGTASAPFTLALGVGFADQHGMMAEQHGEVGTAAYKFKLSGTTANATPVDLFVDAAGTIRPQVPAGSVWLVRAFVIGLVSNSPGSIGNVYTRELRATGKPTGQIGSTVSTAIASDAGFSGSATMTIDGTGKVKLTVTGIAATTINWSAHLEITPVFAS